MIHDDEENLYAEVKAAEAERDQHLRHFKKMVQRSHGRAYKKPGSLSHGMTLENHYHEYVSMMLPRLVLDNPKIRVTSRDDAAMSENAEIPDTEALAHSMNRWVNDTHFDALLTDYATDGFFAWGCAYVYQEKFPGFIPPVAREGLEEDEDVMRPRVMTLDPTSVFWDPLASRRDAIRYYGHCYTRDREDLLEEARKNPDLGWRPNAIKAAADAVYDEDHLEHMDRGEIRIYEVWIPEQRVDDEVGEQEGFNGTLYTLAGAAQEDGTSTGVFLRDPQPWFGPREGPYVIWGVYPVPNDTYWLAPLAAVEDQVQSLNDFTNAFVEGARKAKKGVAINAAEPEVADAIKSFEDQGVFTLQTGNLGIRDAVVPFEVGGPHSELMIYIQAERQRLERVSGITDVQRGAVTGAGTATEVSVADSASNIRVEYVRKQFYRGVHEILRRVAWYMREDRRSRYPVTAAVAQELGMEPGMVWYAPPEDRTPFEAYEFEIEAHSMQRANEGLYQRRVMEFMQMYVQLAGVGLQAPPLAPVINKMLTKAAESLNLGDMGTMITEQAMNQAREQQAVLQMMQQAQNTAGSNPPKPQSEGQAAPAAGRQAGNAQNMGNIMGGI
jgi:hypothetical protein